MVTYLLTGQWLTTGLLLEKSSSVTALVPSPGTTWEESLLSLPVPAMFVLTAGLLATWDTAGLCWLTDCWEIARGILKHCDHSLVITTTTTTT